MGKSAEISVVLLVIALLGSAAVANASLRLPLNEFSTPKRQGPVTGAVQSILHRLNVFPSVDNLRGSTQRLSEKRIKINVPPANLQNAQGDVVGSPDDDLHHYAGYFRLNRTHDARMFYFFFESRQVNHSVPLILWLTGGPGCGSELALFFENGPFTINNDNTSLSWNPYGWDKVGHMLYVDQPVNTGFSYSSDPRDMRHDENGVSKDMLEFFRAFFEVHPEYANSPLFITGESYAGHYLPALATAINNANKAKDEPYIDLKGVAIGNGLTAPYIQYASFPDFAFGEDLISAEKYKAFQKAFIPCGLTARACGTKGKVSCVAAFFTCNAYFTAILGASGDGNRNVYDIRRPCGDQPLCYDFTSLDKFLNQPEIREELGVGDRPFLSCNPVVYEAMLLDFMRSLAETIPPLLEDGIKVLVYVGDKDFICNWLGNSRWVAALEWSGQAEYLTAPWTDFVVDDEVHGVASGYGPLTFLRIYEAGHLVPMDQPSAALSMLRRFVKDEPFVDAHAPPVHSPHCSAKSNFFADSLVDVAESGGEIVLV